ncbi:MAG: AAC(3) family N-acetyltransferase [Pseudomonadota bacterium]
MAHSLERVAADLSALGIATGDTLMVHSSLSALGFVEGGASTVVEALVNAVGAVAPESGTLVMPGFAESLCVPGRHRTLPTPLHEKARRLSPWRPSSEIATNAGTIAETFRQRPGTRRSPHPTDAYLARGAQADAICGAHPLPFATGPDSPAGRLYDLDAKQLLLGVGFNRLTQLHNAESRLPHGRRKTRILPLENRTVLLEDTGDDLDVHFPEIGRLFIAAGHARRGMVGDAQAVVVRSRAVDDFAHAYLAKALIPG